MSVLRAMVIDDEPPAVRRLARLLGEQPAVRVVGTSTSGRRALPMIEQLRPDVLFVDIAMPGLDGFGVVESIPLKDAPAVVFVTAHDQHALRAFDVNAIDYLLKPVAPDRLAAALAKARAIADGRHGDRQLAELRKALSTLRAGVREGESATGFAESFWVHRGREVARVATQSIRWLRAEGDYVRFHASDGRGLLRETLSRMEGKLDPALFVRVHRSVIVRRSELVGLRRQPTGALTARLTGGEEVPIGRRYGEGLRAMLEKMGKPSG